MRWPKLLLILLIVIVVVTGGVVTFLLTLNLNDYRDNISALVTRSTGRTFEINGSIDLLPGRHATLTLTDATLANPDWATEPYMAKISTARITIDLWSLFSRPVVIDQLEIDNSELHLESTANGANNWTFGFSADDNQQDTSAFPLILRHATTTNFRFSLRTPGLPKPLVIDIGHLAQDQDGDDMLSARIGATINGKALDLAGDYGPLASLVSARDLRFDIKGTFDTLTFATQGHIDDLAVPRRPSLQLSATGPDAKHVTEPLGLPDLGAGGVQLDGSLVPTDTSVTAKITGHIAAYKFDAHAQARDLTELRHFSLQGTASGPDLGRALAVAGIDDLPADPFTVKVNARRTGQRLEIDAASLRCDNAQAELTGTVGNLETFRDTNLHLKLDGGDAAQFRSAFGLPGAATGPFSVDAGLQVRSDGSELLQAAVQTRIVTVSARGQLHGKAPHFAGTRLQLDGRGDHLADFSGAWGLPTLPDEPFSVSGPIEIDADRVRAESDVILAVGQDTVRVRGSVGFEPLSPATALTIHANGPDLSRLASLAGIEQPLPQDPYTARGQIAVETNDVTVRNLRATIGKATLTLDGKIGRAADLRGTQLSFTAAGPQLQAFLPASGQSQLGAARFDLSGEIELQTGTLRLRNVAARLAGASGRLDAEVGLPLKSASGQFDGAIHGPDLAAVLPTIPGWQPPADAFTIDAKGTLADGLWTFKTLAATLGSARVTANGVAGPPPAFAGTQLNIDATVPKLASLGKINGDALPATNANATAKLTVATDSITVDPIRVRLGDGGASGSFSYRHRRNKPDFTLVLHSKLLDLSAFDALLEPAKASDASGDKSTAPASDTRLIPDTPLPLARLRAIDGKVDIQADTLRVRHETYRDLRIDGTLLDGRLAVHRFAARSADGTISTTFDVVPDGDTAAIRLDLSGQGIYIGFDGASTPAQVAAAPHIDADITLAGNGRTVRDVAATLSGTVLLTTDGGQILSRGGGLYLGNFVTELLDELNPFAKQDPHTEIRCGALAFSVNNGVVVASPGLFVQTSKIDIASEGSIILGNERVDMRFQTEPRQRLSISAGELINPYLKVGGTLANPHLTLDASNAIVTGGAAVATAGLSLLATTAWKRVFRSKDPCGAVVVEAHRAWADGPKKKKKLLGVF